MTGSSNWPELGCGVGLRNEHYAFVTEQLPKIDWFEAVSENFMTSGGRPLRILEKVRSHYPVVLHGTSLSIGSVDPLSQDYLKKLKTLVNRIEPAMVSDHLCWGGVRGERLHDLLPLPYTQEALEHLLRRIDEVQNFLGRQILLENVSTYLQFEHSEMKEWEFLNEIANRSGCGLLIDLNNIYVNSFNHEFNPYDFLKGISAKNVGQFHLAGHTDMGDYLFDTHTGTVIEEVWTLYREALNMWGKVSTLIEWDEDIPPFKELLGEAEKAKALYTKAPSIETTEAKNVQNRKIKETAKNSGPDLSDVQVWFRDKIKSESKNNENRLSVRLRAQRRTPGEKRLEVYADGYKARIFEALREVYPAAQHILGEHRLMHLAENYATEFPSREYNLSLAGRHFKKFIESSKLSEEFPFLSDLAHLEWMVSESFHAFDGEKLTSQDFSKIEPSAWDKVRFKMQPSLKTIQSKWPVLDLWQARKTPVHDIDIKLENRPQNVLIYRTGENVRCQLLSDEQFFVLSRLLQGKAFGAICEDIAEREDLNPPLKEWLARWLQLGFFCGFDIAHDSQVIARS